MPITYVRLVHTKPQPDVFRATFEELEEESILLFDPVKEATGAHAADLYRRLAPSIRLSDIIVFRGTGEEFVRSLEGDATLRGLLSGKLGGALVSVPSPESPGP